MEDVFSIDYQQLFDKGCRGLIFDIDNTLVPHGADSTPEIDDLFSRLHGIGFKTILLSNNSEKRIRRFMKNIDTLFVAEAGKPDPDGFLRALDLLGCTKEEVVVVGDQVFTDIRGANRAGLRSILVKYIGHEKREWKGFHRYLEQLILLFYPRSRRIV